MGINYKMLTQKVAIFNKIGEKENREEYHISILDKVKLEERIAISHTAEGQAAFDSFKLYIDAKYSKAFYKNSKRLFMHSYAFKDLIPERRAGFWTVNEGDYIVSDIPNDFSLENGNIENLKRICKVYTINAFVPVYAAEGIHHWEVSGRGKILE